jgi:hypothetical protein
VTYGGTHRVGFGKYVPKAQESTMTNPIPPTDPTAPVPPPPEHPKTDPDHWYTDDAPEVPPGGLLTGNPLATTAEAEPAS